MLRLETIFLSILIVRRWYSTCDVIVHASIFVVHGFRLISHQYQMQSKSMAFKGSHDVEECIFRMFLVCSWMDKDNEHSITRLVF